MANWRHTLHFASFYNNDDIPIKKKADLVIKEINRVFPDPDYVLKDIIDEFTGVEDVEDFDSVMEQLYDWADVEVSPYGKWPRNARCWIETFSAKPKAHHPVHLQPEPDSPRCSDGGLHNR